VLVAGDSAALVLGRRSPYDTVDSRGVAFGSSSCGFGGGIPLVGSTRIPVQPECYRFDDDLAIAVDGFRPDVAVLVVGGELALDREVDGATLRYGTAELEAHVRRQLDRARSTLTARGARFVLASPSCNRLPGADNAARDAWLRGVFARWAAARGVATIDLGGFECAAGVPTVVDGVPLYDGTSLSDHGVEVVWRWILDEVGEL
jgi:hypothetical protein